MFFEDEWEETLICMDCNEDIDICEYGLTAEEIDEKRCSHDRYIWDDDLSDIPEGCAACGGPYPDCMSSCALFDD